ncbi:Thaumatin-like protein 1 [Glycine soja]|nr:Thaumatin-like protein 1 [Glycine soja]
MRLHSVARHSLKRRNRHASNNRFRSSNRRVQNRNRSNLLGWPFLGPHTLHARLRRKILLPQRRLQLKCSGNGAAPPATLAEFTLDGAGGLNFFDVSLVDGYNVPMLVAPQGGSGDNCTSTGCAGDLNGACPSELRVTSVDGKQSVACKSACEAFGSPQYCCSGAYGSPTTCKPSPYSQIFKNACPRAYSYAYDDKTSTFTCASAAAYTITFCPSPSSNPSQKSWQGQNPKSDSSGSASASASGSPQLNNGTMVYVGSMDESELWSAGSTHGPESQTIAGFVSITIAVWLLCHLY